MAHLGIVTSRSRPSPLITLSDVAKAAEEVPRWALVFKVSYESLNVFYERGRERERERERTSRAPCILAWAREVGNSTSGIDELVTEHGLSWKSASKVQVFLTS